MRQIAHAAAAAALLLSAGCGPQSSPAPDPAEPINPPTPSTAPQRSDAIRFDTTDGRGVFIESASQVSKLAGTSPSFKAFIADQVAQLTRPPGASGCDLGVGVAVYDPSGFARGNVSACGGYAALWGIQDGKWKELIGTQDLWACADLRKYKVPSSMADSCYESMKEVPYAG